MKSLFNTTGFKNLLRRFFMNPSGENFLQNNIINNQHSAWKKFIPPHYLYKRGSLRKTTIRGIYYEFDISNQVDHYTYFGMEEPGYRLIIDDIKNSQLILDIGANNASSSLYFASINPEVTILAFEPHPGTFQKAVRNLALNKFPRIELINMALSDSCRTTTLYEVDASNTGMNRILPGTHPFPSVDIFTNTLDLFFSENNYPDPGVIKIDVEGHEYNVLKGGEVLILRCHPVLFIELDNDNLEKNSSSASQLVRLLNEYGYTNIVNALDGKQVQAGDNFDNSHYDIIARPGKKTSPGYL